LLVPLLMPSPEQNPTNIENMMGEMASLMFMFMGIMIGAFVIWLIIRIFWASTYNKKHVYSLILQGYKITGFRGKGTYSNEMFIEKLKLSENDFVQ